MLGFERNHGFLDDATGKGGAATRIPLDRTARANTERETKLAARLEPVDAREEDGEPRFLVDGAPLVDGIFPDEEEAPFIAAQWRQKARRTLATEKFTAKKLVNALPSSAKP